MQTIIKEYGVSTKPQGTRVAIVTFNAAAEIKFNLATNVMNDTDQAMRELGKIFRRMIYDKQLLYLHA